MDSIALKVSGLAYKVRKLIEQKKDLESKLAALGAENESLRQAMDDQIGMARRQEKELALLHASRSISGNGDTTAAKEKINELIREIDRCILLLND